MELILYSQDFEHIKEGSVYNHNYYKYIKKDSCLPTIIYEVCDENYETYEFFLKEGDNLVFLGSSYKSLSFDSVISIDFRMNWT